MVNQLEKERQRRIQVALWAYAYEFEADSMVSDDKFDAICLLIDSSISTDKPELDKFFKEVFTPYTGMWIHNHPELDKVAALYKRLKENKSVAETN